MKIRVIVVSLLFVCCICYSASAQEADQSTTLLSVVAQSPQTDIGAVKLPVKVGAQLRLRPEQRDNTDYGGNRNYTLLRFRMSAEFKASSDTLIFFQPQFSKVFGDPVYVGTSPTQNRYYDSSGAFFDTPLIVHQAYFDYRPFPDFQIIGGRQVLTYGDEILIGAALGWANVGRSFDAIKFIYKKQGSFQSDLFWSRLVDTASFTEAGNGSADFGGFYNNFSFGKYLKNFDPYVLYLADTRVPAPLSLWTWGVRLKSPVERFDYRFETDYQLGSARNTSQTGHQADLEIGYLIDSSHKLRVAVEGFTTSPNFNQLFPAGHRWLGIADVLGRRNISGGALKSSISPVTRWTLNCDYFQFYRTSTDYPGYKLNGMVPLGSAKASSAATIGSELDINAVLQLSPTVNLSAGVNTLFSSDYLVQNFGSVNPMYVFVEMETLY